MKTEVIHDPSGPCEMTSQHPSAVGNLANQLY